jgi:hypothetical protein
MINNLELVWADHYTATIELEDNPVSRYMVHCVKHLQHLPLEFSHRDNPLLQVESWKIHRIFLEAARLLDVEIDPEQLGDQRYLNRLHDVYVDSYSRTNDPRWIAFHDALHSVEDVVKQDRKSIWVDYKQRAGPLIRPFDRSLTQYFSPTVAIGDCGVGHAELGKNLWDYYRDQEPLDDLDRICAVVKPWQYLKPVLSIFYQPCAEHTSPYHSDRVFREWVDRVVTPWAQHWAIPDWSPREIHARLRMGRLRDAAEALQRFGGGNTPVRLRLKQ